MKTEFTIDSSTNQCYKDMVKEKDAMRAVLRKHLDQFGIYPTSRFFDGAYEAMKEWNDSHPKAVKK